MAMSVHGGTTKWKDSKNIYNNHHPSFVPSNNTPEGYFQVVINGRVQLQIRWIIKGAVKGNLYTNNFLWRVLIRKINRPLVIYRARNSA